MSSHQGVTGRPSDGNKLAQMGNSTHGGVGSCVRELNLLQAGTTGLRWAAWEQTGKERGQGAVSTMNTRAPSRPAGAVPVVETAGSPRAGAAGPPLLLCGEGGSTRL